MDAQQFATYLAEQNYRVVKTASSYWYEIHPFCFQNIPYHCGIAPSAEEINYLFFKKLAILVRYNSINKPGTIPGFIWLYDEHDYGIDYLDRHIKYQTRRGLKNTEVKLIDFDLLIDQGLSLIHDTCKRQGRTTDFVSEKEWIKCCQAAKRFNDIEAWGGFKYGRLIAFIVGGKLEDYYYFLVHASDSRYFKYYPNNALYYTITYNKIKDPSIKGVSVGIHSVEPTHGVDKFKLGMRFRCQEINFKVIVNPLFIWIKHQTSKNALENLTRIFPKNNYFRKANALLGLIK